MHAGFPMLDDLLALMYAHPQVYVEIGVIVYTQPRNGTTGTSKVFSTQASANG